MIESIGKLLVNPLAERWKGAAIGGSLVLWLFICGLVLFTRDISLGAGNWPIDCRSAAGRAAPSWCSVAASDRTAIALVALAAVIIGTAFLAQALAPSVLALVQGRGWGDWPVLSFLPRAIQAPFRKIRPVKYPTAQFPGGLRPTRVGNRLAALTERVNRRFGFRIEVVWDVLIESLPENARGRLVSKSQSIMLASQHLLLGVVATVTAAFVLPGGWPRLVMPLISLLITIGLWRSLATVVDEYCDLVITALILHHNDLYIALRETPPGPNDNLRQQGIRLTQKIDHIIR